MKLSAALLIVRPANVVTAIADVIAGIAIVGYLQLNAFSTVPIHHYLLLCLATACLYAGGIVFNDVFDIKSDTLNRPERVIPSGKLTLKQAKKLGTYLFAIAIGSCFFVSKLSFVISISIALCALLYDKYGKHHSALGPVNMGLCRGLNLILGMSILTDLPFKFYLIAIIPVIFITAITLTAQKETKGKNKLAIGLAIVLDTLVVVGFGLLYLYYNFNLKNALVFVSLWYAVNAFAKLKAILHNEPAFIMKAVKTGILSLIPLNASYVAGFSNISFAMAVLCLLPLSIFLAKKFPVT